MADKFDVFVGNLTFNTTEEQLRELFQFIGPVKHIRILSDKETGKPKGFAFVEYFDSNSALSAIKHLDQAELNGRKIKVGFPSQSSLREVARQIGHGTGPDSETGGFSLGLYQQRQQQEQAVINSLKLHEAWDILDSMKTLVMDDSKAEKLKTLLDTYPQIISAIYEIEKRLGIALPAHIQQQLANPFSAMGLGVSNSLAAPPSSSDSVLGVRKMPPASSSSSSASAMAMAGGAAGPFGEYYGNPNVMMNEEEALMMSMMNSNNNMTMPPNELAMMNGNSNGTGLHPPYNGGYYGEGGEGLPPPMHPLDPYGAHPMNPTAGGGRVSRFGAPDHSQFLNPVAMNNAMMMNAGPPVGGGGGGGYYDQYGNEFFLPDYSSNNLNNQTNNNNRNN